MVDSYPSLGVANNPRAIQSYPSMGGASATTPLPLRSRPYTMIDAMSRALFSKRLSREAWNCCRHFREKLLASLVDIYQCWELCRKKERTSALDSGLRKRRRDRTKKMRAGENTPNSHHTTFRNSEVALEPFSFDIYTQMFLVYLSFPTTCSTSMLMKPLLLTSLTV
jgi:hypothetical protein